MALHIISEWMMPAQTNTIKRMTDIETHAFNVKSLL